MNVIKLIKGVGNLILSIAFVRVGMYIESKAFDMSCSKSQSSCLRVVAVSMIVVSCEMGCMVDWKGRAA